MPKFQDSSLTTKRARAIKAARQLGYSDAEISDELARQDAATDKSPLVQSLPAPTSNKSRRVLADASAVSRTPRATPGLLDLLVPKNAMTMLEVGSDIAGVPGNIADILGAALPGRTRQGNRDQRQARRNSLSLEEGIVSALVPAMIPGNVGAMFNANLSSSVPKYIAASLAAANTKGLKGVGLRATGRLRDAAFAGLTQGVGENAGTTSGTLGPAAVGLVGGGAIGSLGAPAIKGIGWLAENAPYAGPYVKKLINRSPQMSNAEKSALEHVEVAQKATPSQSSVPTTYDPPTRVMDVAGADLEALLQSAANTPRGRRVLEENLPSRANQGWEALMASLVKNTDVTPQQADEMALRIADLTESRAAQDVVDKTKHYEFELLNKEKYDAAKAASEVKPTLTSVLDAMESQYGKPKSVLELLELRDTMVREADDVYYSEARKISAEQGIQEPKNWDEIKNTAVGMEAIRQAERVGHAAALNDPRRAVPTSEIGELGGDPGPRSINRGSEDIIHATKQQLMFMAGEIPGQKPPRNSPNELRSALEAAKALEPYVSPAFQRADAQHTINKAGVRRVEQGLTLPQSNPGAEGYRTQSLEARQRSQAALSGDALRESQVAQQRALFGLIEDGSSPESLIKGLGDSRSTISQAWDLAFGEGSAKSFSDLLQVPDAPAAYKPSATPLPLAQTLEEQQARRGLGILTTNAAGTEADPERTLANLEKYIANLPLREQATVRRYAATKFQEKLGQRKALKLDVPENLRQLKVATGAPQAAERVAATEAAWNKSQRLDASYLAGGTPLRQQDSRGFFGAAADIYSPSNPWMAAKAARTMAKAANNSAADLEGEELIKLAIGGEKTLQEKIARLRSIKGLNEAGQRRVATTLARILGVTLGEGESPR